jgi:hypothetical protein
MGRWGKEWKMLQQSSDLDLAISSGCAQGAQFKELSRSTRREAEVGAYLDSLSQNFVEKWKDIQTDPSRECVLFFGHYRDEIVLVVLAPCRCFVTLQEVVSAIFTL